MANIEAIVPVPTHATNGDEGLYANKIGNYTKGLPHNAIGEVEASAYATYSTAISSGLPSDLDAIPLRGATKLTNPQAGLAFDLEGMDGYQLVEPPPPAVASRQRADEAVELYWMALARDVPFSQYGAEPITPAAIAELNQLKGFTGPRVNGQVTAQTLFRTDNYGDTIGPWVSQLLLQNCNFGALAMEQQYNTYTPGVDFMTDFASWLAIQNGANPASSDISAGSVYLKDGRGIGAWVHVDQLYQAYFMGMLWMLTNRTPFNAGNPYNSSAESKRVWNLRRSPHPGAAWRSLQPRATSSMVPKVVCASRSASRRIRRVGATPTRHGELARAPGFLTRPRFNRSTPNMGHGCCPGLPRRLPTLLFSVPTRRFGGACSPS